MKQTSIKDKNVLCLLSKAKDLKFFSYYRTPRGGSSSAPGNNLEVVVLQLLEGAWGLKFFNCRRNPGLGQIEGLAAFTCFKASSNASPSFVMR